jgi:hypothetical protein
MWLIDPTKLLQPSKSYSRDKFEARNPKFETNSNDRNSKLKTLRFGKFEHLDLGFVSRFDIRISDLKIR